MEVSRATQQVLTLCLKITLLTWAASNIIGGMMSISRPANATQTYITAGGVPKSAKISACKLLKHPKVQEALDRQQERLRRDLNVSRESIYSELRSVIDNPETNTTEMLRAIDMLCRMFGLYNQPLVSHNDV
jgi:hypothetical protein